MAEKTALFAFIFKLVIITSSLIEIPEAKSEQLFGRDNATTGWPMHHSPDSEWQQKRIETIEKISLMQKEVQINLTEVTIMDSLRHAYTRGENIRTLTINTQSYAPDRKFVGDPIFVDSNSAEHKLRCQRDLKFYEKALDSVLGSDPENDKNPYEFLMLADSFGRPQAGALEGSQFWLGSYLQCLDINLKRADDDFVKSQYCLGLTQFPKWNKTEYWTAIKVGLCLPETCTTSMINENSQLLATVEKMMMGQFVTAGPYSRLKLNEVYCLPHETSSIRQFTTSGYCFILLIGAFVVSSVVATLIDHRQTNSSDQSERKRTPRQILIESFSLIRNVNKFLDVRKADQSSLIKQAEEKLDGKTDIRWVYDRSLFLDTICGMKCCALIMIICGHTLSFGFAIRSNNILDYDRYIKSPLGILYGLSHLSVDTFYAISGILTAYFLFKTGLDNIKLKQWLVLIMHRYWRLTPIYLLCFWFAKSVAVIVNSGPMVDFSTAENSYRQICARESWLVPLLHLADFKSPRDHCVLMAYYIANAMKFYIITPIFLIILHKSLRLGYLATICTTVASSIYIGTTIMGYKIPHMTEPRPESVNIILHEMQEIYARPYSRIGPYLVGLLTGNLLYLLDAGKFRIKLSKNFIKISWFLAPIILSIFVFGTAIIISLELDEDAILRLLAICNTFLRTSWAIFNCWLIVALAHGQAKWLSSFLGANLWHILSKLCFCSFLIQMEIFSLVYHQSLQANSSSQIDLITQPISILVIALFVGLLMVLFIEYPLTGIEGLLLPKRPSKTNSPKVPEDAEIALDKIDRDNVVGKRK